MGGRERVGGREGSCRESPGVRRMERKSKGTRWVNSSIEALIYTDHIWAI